MATTFTPTFAKDLKQGDLLDAHAEKVTVATPCRIHRGNVYIEVAGFDERGHYNGVGGDICCDPHDVFVVRTTN